MAAVVAASMNMLSVVVECESAAGWAKRYRLPSRMGIEKLRDGLDRLAKIMGVS